MTQTTLPGVFTWAGGGWGLGLQSNGQTSGGTQFWNLKIARS